MHDTPADILLGGGGADVITGKDGNDIIDGDRWLNTRIGIVRNGVEVATAEGMSTAVTDLAGNVLHEGRSLSSLMIDRVYAAGELKIVRELLDGDAANTSVDVAVYRGQVTEYDFFRHADGSGETVPFFGLDTPALKDVFAPSCLSCFDYTNAGADLVVGYMGAEFGRQWITVRNPRGQRLLDLVEGELDTAPVTSRGDRRAAVQQGIGAYDKAVRLPLWLAEVIGFFVQRFGPKGLEYGRFSIDSHFTRNALWLQRHHPEIAERHIPTFARRIVERYRLPDVERIDK
jgi:hypothetical protein